MQGGFSKDKSLQWSVIAMEILRVGWSFGGEEGGGDGDKGGEVEGTGP